MSDALSTLLREMRQLCRGNVWGLGHDLAHTARVSRICDGTWQVADLRGGPSHTVELDLEHGDWSCSCSGADPCAHVIAAALAERHQKIKPASSLQAEPGQLRYELTHTPPLTLRRRVMSCDGKRELGEIHTSLRDWEQQIHPLRTHSVDHAIDALLHRDLCEAGRLAETLATLGAADQSLWVEDVPVRLSPKIASDQLQVTRQRGGVYLKLCLPVTLERVIVDGVAVNKDGTWTGYRCLRPENLGLRPTTHSGPDIFLTHTEFAAYQARWGAELTRKGIWHPPPAPPPGNVRAAVWIDALVPEDGRVQLSMGLAYGDPVTAVCVGGRWAQGGPDGARGPDHAGKRLLDQIARTPLGDALHRPHWVNLASLGPQLASATDPAKRLLLGPAAQPVSAWLEQYPEAQPATIVWDAEGRPLLQHPDGHRAALEDAQLAPGGWAWTGKWWKLPPESPWGEPAWLEQCADPSRRRSAIALLAGTPPASRHTGPSLGRPLRDYQHVGAVWATRLHTAGLGGILADEMGLGKTSQIAAVLVPGSLVVVPRSLLTNWRRELELLRPDLDVFIYGGAKRNAAELQTTPGVWLTSYGILLRDAAALGQATFTCLVFDEAQQLRNPGSQTYRAAANLSALSRFALTGTPIENHPEDLLHLASLVLPGWHKILARTPTDRLGRTLGPFMLRRTKAQVAPELPARDEHQIDIELSEAELAFYHQLLQRCRARLQPGASPLALLAALTRLRRAACDPALVDPTWNDQVASKVEYLIAQLLVLRASGQKGLIFSQWTSFLDRIAAALHRANITSTRIDGQTADRAAAVDRFQNDPQINCMLLSLKAAGTGLNLTAATHVWLMDPWWNPAAEAQAADRAHRIGQHQPVSIYRIVAAGTIETKVRQLAETKRLTAAQILSGNSAPLSPAELEELIAGS